MRSYQVALTLLFAASLLSSNATAQTLHAILIADTDSNIGLSVAADVENLEKTLRNGLPASKLSIKKIDGSSVSPSYLKQYIRNLPIQPNDPVLVYYSGHGGFDPNRGHFLATEQGRLYRSELINSLTQPYTPKFWALITDCCANYSRYTTTPYVQSPDSTRLLTHLFFETNGNIDITSSKPGQVSMGMADGGLFTKSLCNVLKENADRSLNWDRVFRTTRSRAARLAERYFDDSDTSYRGYPQRTQIAWSFDTMYGQNVNDSRLGIGLNGRWIQQVDSGSAASNGGLKPGMTVVGVNGYRVDNDQDIRAAVFQSPQDATIQVRTASGTRQYSVELAF